MAQLRVITSNPSGSANELAVALVAATGLDRSEAEALVRLLSDHALPQVVASSLNEELLMQIAMVLKDHGYDVAIDA